jgi:hypothetical protein
MTTGLDALKAQLNIVDNTDDDMLARKLAAAEVMVSNDTGALTPVTYATATADLAEAIMMMAAHFYENREAVLVGITAQTLPLGYADLIASSRKWVF